MGSETCGSVGVDPCQTSAGTLGRLIHYRLRASLKLPIFSILDHSDPLTRRGEIRVRNLLLGLLRYSDAHMEKRHDGYRASNKRHGTLPRYSSGCRCPWCKRAYRNFRESCRKAGLLEYPKAPAS